jgi:ABC-2 type transport system permease protein
MMRADLAAALWAELVKARRSLVPWVTLAAFTLGGLVNAMFAFVMQDAARARSLGMLGGKAQVFGDSADWGGYLSLTTQIVGVGGLMVFGIVTIWLFGREFSDRTAKDLLALPVARSTVVAAKYLLALGWCLALTGHILVVTLAAGAALRLDGWSGSLVVGGMGRVLVVALLTAALAAGYGLVASVARGYLAAVGALFLSLLASQVVAALGLGRWFPWSVPGLLSGAGGPGQPLPGAVGVSTVVLVGVAAVAATMAWWERADHG